MIERAPSLPLLVIGAFRPEFEPPWVGQAHVTMTLLGRLSAQDGARLVHQVAGSTPPAEGVVDEIISRADGVPLFVEELTKAVVELGVAVMPTVQQAAHDVPPTLHASLMARLDRAESAKEIAQIGAAIGREFSYELLAAVSRHTEAELQSGLERLAKLGLLFRRGVPPHATYLFKHALVQDAAYAALLKGRRQHLHAAIAKVLEEHFSALVQAQPEVVAHHYTSAGLHLQSVGYGSRRASWQTTAQPTTRPSHTYRKASSC